MIFSATHVVDGRIYARLNTKPTTISRHPRRVSQASNPLSYPPTQIPCMDTLDLTISPKMGPIWRSCNVD
jgi:hypothetical protein